MFGDIIEEKSEEPVKENKANNKNKKEVKTSLESLVRSRHEYTKNLEDLILNIHDDNGIDLEEADTRFSTAMRITAMRNKKVVIIGAGGIGTWVIRALVGMGIKDITVIDDDLVEIHNVGPQAHNLADIGISKVEAMQKAMLEYKGIKITAVQKRISDYKEILEICGGVPPFFLITAIDNMDLRKTLGTQLVVEADRTEANYPLPDMYIDLRMGLGQWNAFALPVKAMGRYVKRDDELLQKVIDLREYFNEHCLFDDSEGVQEACTERAIVYTGANIASYVCALVHWVNDNPLNSPTKVHEYLDLDDRNDATFRWARSFQSREWTGAQPGDSNSKLLKSFTDMANHVKKVEEKSKSLISMLKGLNGSVVEDFSLFNTENNVEILGVEITVERMYENKYKQKIYLSRKASSPLQTQISNTQGLYPASDLEVITLPSNKQFIIVNDEELVDVEDVYGVYYKAGSEEQQMAYNWSNSIPQTVSLKSKEDLKTHILIDPTTKEQKIPFVECFLGYDDKIRVDDLAVRPTMNLWKKQAEVFTQVLGLDIVDSLGNPIFVDIDDCAECEGYLTLREFKHVFKKDPFEIKSSAYKGGLLEDKEILEELGLKFTSDPEEIVEGRTYAYINENITNSTQRGLSVPSGYQGCWVPLVNKEQDCVFMADDNSLYVVDKRDVVCHITVDNPLFEAEKKERKESAGYTSGNKIRLLEKGNIDWVTKMDDFIGKEGEIVRGLQYGHPELGDTLEVKFLEKDPDSGVVNNYTYNIYTNDSVVENKGRPNDVIIKEGGIYKIEQYLFGEDVYEKAKEIKKRLYLEPQVEEEEFDVSTVIEEQEQGPVQYDINLKEGMPVLCGETSRWSVVKSINWEDGTYTYGRNKTVAEISKIKSTVPPEEI